MAVGGLGKRIERGGILRHPQKQGDHYSQNTLRETFCCFWFLFLFLFLSKRMYRILTISEHLISFRASLSEIRYTKLFLQE